MTYQTEKPEGFHYHDNGEWIVSEDNGELVGYPVKKQKIRENSITMNIPYQDFLRIFPEGKSINRSAGLRLLPSIRSEIVKMQEVGYTPLAVFFEALEFHYKRPMRLEPATQYKVQSVVDGEVRDFVTATRNEAVEHLTERAESGAESISFTTVTKSERRVDRGHDVLPEFNGEKGLSHVTIRVHLSYLRTFIGWAMVLEDDNR